MATTACSRSEASFLTPSQGHARKAMRWKDGNSALMDRAVWLGLVWCSLAFAVVLTDHYKIWQVSARIRLSLVSFGLGTMSDARG